MLRRWQATPPEGLVKLVLALVTALIFGLAVWQMVFNVLDGDYGAHIGFARIIIDYHHFTDVHLLYQAIIIGLKDVFPLSYELAGWIAAVAFYVIAALVLYGLMRTALGGGWRSVGIAAVGALALLFVMPINLLTLPAHNLYFGYIGINVLHNPTIVMLKPFALLLFSFTVGLLKRPVRLNRHTMIVGVLLVTLALLAKPNYVLILLPALLVVIAYRLYRRNRASLAPLLAALVVPMIVLLALTYVLMFLLIDNGEGGIIFAPLRTLANVDPVLISVLIKFILSILFPALVYLLYWKQTIRDSTLNLAWLCFFAGAGQMYLFAEKGERLVSGNFWWGAQIGLFVLFVFSALFCLRHWAEQPRWRGWLCFAVFLLHLLSGLIYYVVQFQSTAMSTWW